MDFISPESKAFKKTLVALFLGSFIMFADLYCTQPVIAVIAAQFNVPPAAASLSLSAATGALALFLLFVSFTSGMYDRKRVMILALVSSAFLSITVGFIQNLPLLIAVRFVQGALLAGYPSIAMAYINEEFDKKVLGYVIGIYVSGNSLGGLAGRLIVGSLSDAFSWNTAIALLGLLNLVMCVLFMILLPKSKHFDSRHGSMKRTTAGFLENIESPALVFLYLIGFILMGSFVTIYNYFGIPLLEPPYNLSQTLIGFIFVIFLVGTFSSTWMGRLSDHMSRSGVIGLCLIMMICGLALTMSPLLAVKIFGLAMFTFGFFGGHSVASSWVGILANRREKAQSSSLYLLFYYVGSSVVGSVGGLFLEWYGWTGLVIAIALLCTIGMTLCYFVRRMVLNGACHRYRRHHHNHRHSMAGQHI
ncbi:MFS transporter [Sporolactobacillus inulinus]|uniref:Permeases of the major facilitator superfamily n=2 Tax=Sporolactobacillus inulinus TaxID=2078 RepID=A0A4Y3T386_9BACL|nr:MFS transporter [Sporolactobacillus inulinus]KLI03793.1 MFS transporter [Sporolactobacillus inulinus CASD]GAY75861.1 permeases of the major facilitator superfamily [Sporolactobacillus inulinus]GEB76542.1 putative MFS-type transporter YybF [Sporolactobacillus inulinus]